MPTCLFVAECSFADICPSLGLGYSSRQSVEYVSGNGVLGQLRHLRAAFPRAHLCIRSPGGRAHLGHTNPICTSPIWAQDAETLDAMPAAASRPVRDLVPSASLRSQPEAPLLGQLNFESGWQWGYWLAASAFLLLSASSAFLAAFRLEANSLQALVAWRRPAGLGGAFNQLFRFLPSKTPAPQRRQAPDPRNSARPFRLRKAARFDGASPGLRRCAAAAAGRGDGPGPSKKPLFRLLLLARAAERMVLSSEPRNTVRRPRSQRTLRGTRTQPAPGAGPGSEPRFNQRAAQCGVI